jgi:hypothetical protein
MSSPEHAENSDQVIDAHEFIKALRSDQLGLFEPLSGVLLLNVAESEFQEVAVRWSSNTCTESDVELLRTINHETYHFMQTVCSGYMYDRQCRIFTELNRENEAAENEAETESYASVMEAALKDLDASDPERQRLMGVAAMIRQQEFLEKLGSRAAPGDHSISGGSFPKLFQYLDALAVKENEANAEGLSILSVIEGTAVAHAQLLMGGVSGFDERMAAECSTLPPAYAALYEVTQAACGNRTAELLLPAASFALMFEQPHQAYLPILREFLNAPAHDAGQDATYVSERIDMLPDLGPILGTSLDVRMNWPAYVIYQSVLNDVEAGKWGTDPYWLLASPAAMNGVPSFPMGFLTRDGFRGAGLDRDILIARMFLMSVVLRVKSRRKLEKAVQERLAGWAQDVFGRLME